MRTTLVAVMALASALHAQQPARDTTDIDELLDRLGRYIATYETELSTVVAQERYEQLVPQGAQSVAPVTGGPGLPFATRVQRMSKRILESDVAFLRLPGGAEWFGVRDVKLVDGKAVPASRGGRLLELVPRFNESQLAAAAAIVMASAEHNLGGLRTINMPTVPLEVVRFANHARFEFKVKGTDRINGVTTRRLDFEEFDTPTIIQGPQGEPLMAHGSVWLDPQSGCVWRVEVIATPDSRDYRVRQLYETRVRVEFMRDANVGLVVPKEMTEEFFSARGRGQGRALYSNYKRFTTGARIVPQ